jgi:hypothetical protein
MMNYTGLLLTGLFPQAPEAAARGAAQLVDVMLGQPGARTPGGEPLGAPSGERLPPGFLEQLVRRHPTADERRACEPPAPHAAVPAGLCARRTTRRWTQRL